MLAKLMTAGQDPCNQSKTYVATLRMNGAEKTESMGISNSAQASGPSNLRTDGIALMTDLQVRAGSRHLSGASGRCVPRRELLRSRGP